MQLSFKPSWAHINQDLVCHTDMLNLYKIRKNRLLVYEFSLDRSSTSKFILHLSMKKMLSMKKSFLFWFKMADLICPQICYLIRYFALICIRCQLPSLRVISKTFIFFPVFTLIKLNNYLICDLNLKLNVSVCWEFDCCIVSTWCVRWVKHGWK